jgi:hypothetical protein
VPDGSRTDIAATRDGGRTWEFSEDNFRFGDDLSSVDVDDEYLYIVWGDNRAGFQATWYARIPLSAYCSHKGALLPYTCRNRAVRRVGPPASTRIPPLRPPPQRLIFLPGTLVLRGLCVELLLFTLPDCRPGKGSRPHFPDWRRGSVGGADR